MIAFWRKGQFKPLLLESVVKVNLERARHVADLMKKELGKLGGRKIAVLGLSFKPDTSDMRDAPSIRIIDIFCKEDAVIHVYDPRAMKEAKRNPWR